MLFQKTFLNQVLLYMVGHSEKSGHFCFILMSDNPAAHFTSTKGLIQGR